MKALVEICNDCNKEQEINLHYHLGEGILALCRECEYGERHNARLEEDEQDERERLEWLEELDK